MAKADDLDSRTLAGMRNILTDSQKTILSDMSGVTAWRAGYLKKLKSLVDTEVKRINKLLDELATGNQSAAWELGQEMVKNSFKKIKIDIPFKMIPEKLLLALKADTHQLIQDITDEMRDRIRVALNQAAIGGVSPAESAGVIKGVLGIGEEAGVAGRAEKIVRTELGRTFSVAEQATMDQAGEALPGLKKEWQTAADERVRADHIAANGQVVPYDEPFLVGGEKLMFPRDPAGSPENVINCRCTMVPVLPETGKEE